MLYFGLDWGVAAHHLCIINEAGARVSACKLPHTLQGFERIETERHKLQVGVEECVVGIESAHNLLVDYLMDRGYHIYIIPPNATPSHRKRQRQSGAYNDPSDAAALANAVRTDRHLLREWRPNAPLTQEVLSQVRLVQSLGVTIQRQRAQLEAVLWRAYPVACDLFSELTAKIALEFLMAYPSLEEAEALSIEEFERFCRSQRYTRRDLISRRYAQLQEPSEVPAPVASAYRENIRVLARMIVPQLDARRDAISRLQKLFSQHPDREIFASLPGAGEILAPALLAKFGDDRDRFANAGQVQALAGTCPVMRESGSTRHVVSFRRACDREFRRIVQQFAFGSIKQSGWAHAYWQEARLRRASYSHATRIVANRWLAIIWKMWQTRKPYDEGYHLRQRAERRKPQRMRN